MSNQHPQRATQQSQQLGDGPTLRQHHVPRQIDLANTSRFKWLGDAIMGIGMGYF